MHYELQLIVFSILSGVCIYLAYRCVRDNAEITRQRRELEALESAKNLWDADAIQLTDLKITRATLETQNQLLKEQLQTLKDSIQQTQAQSQLSFENLANKILEVKTQKMTSHAEKNIDALLKPLKEKIQTFEKAVDEKYTTEAKERHALKSEIERLIKLNDQMSHETSALTQALRGDSKLQGDWGEMVLERVLEVSGLRKDHEYSLQKSLSNDQGERLRPDVIINLPDEKHIIVDAKVSLTAYERYYNQDETSAMREHIKSIVRHVDDLSSKHYAKSKEIHSPEIVFMFIPIEPAYVLAMKNDPNLIGRAWKKGIAIVTATTLLTSLKTVASIWKLENQNKNALKIADEGAKMYDKFVGFVNDFEKIGHTFDNGQKLYLSAMAKLRDGPGNVFKKMERLRELGAAPKKKL